MYSIYPVFVSLFYRNAISYRYQFIKGKRVAILGIARAWKFHIGLAQTDSQY